MSITHIDTSLYACLHVLLYVCLFVCMPIYIYIYIYICMYVCLSVWLYVCLSVCVSVCIYVCVCMCVCVCVVVCVCVCVCVCVFACVMCHHPHIYLLLNPPFTIAWTYKCVSVQQHGFVVCHHNIWKHISPEDCKHTHLLTPLYKPDTSTHIYVV
jgi:hypothetical protein